MTAVKVDQQDDFNYAVDSRQGRVLANGNFSAKTKSLARFDEMTQGFTYVKRTKEHYTAHTSCSKKSCRTYYTWDSVGSDESYADKVSIYGREYPANLFDFSKVKQDMDACKITAKDTSSGWFSSKHGCSESWGTGYYYIDSNDRYSYEVVPLNFNATFITTTYNGTLQPLNQDHIVLENKSIKEVLVEVGKYHLYAFWGLAVFLFILTIAAIVIGYQWVMYDGVWSLDR